MREIVMDTETTGLDNASDQIVEIGGVELINHLPSGRTYHQYIRPTQAQMHPEAEAVHGISMENLAGKPTFPEIADAFLAFVGDAKLVIHNASFDIGFLNAELRRFAKPEIPWAQAIDTLDIARKKFPGAQASLDALCKRFGVDNSVREKHGALLDSELLAEVYLELLGGRQQGLILESHGGRGAGPVDLSDWTPPPRPRPLKSRLTEAEKAAHDAFVAELGDKSIWRA